MLFREVTGRTRHFFKGAMLGCGQYDDTYVSGHSGTSFATGFAPRKAKLSIHIIPGRLGKHTKGKACLYLNKLADADQDVLAKLIRAGLNDLAPRWPVRAAQEVERAVRSHRQFGL